MLHDQPLGVHQVIRRYATHLVGFGYLRIPAVRPHVDAFDLVFVNRLSPISLIRVQRYVEEDDRPVGRFFLDLAEIGQVADTRHAPTRPEVEQNHLPLELAQRYGLVVEIREGEFGRGLSGLQLQGSIQNRLDGLIVFRMRVDLLGTLPTCAGPLQSLHCHCA